MSVTKNNTAPVFNIYVQVSAKSASYCHPFNLIDQEQDRGVHYHACKTNTILEDFMTAVSLPISGYDRTSCGASISYCSNLSASTGFILAAFLAGTMPEIIPTNIENASAKIIS